MLIRQEHDLDPIITEVFDLLVGYDIEQQNRRKQSATRRLYEARRAIEKHREQEALATFIDRERWFEDE